MRFLGTSAIVVALILLAAAIAQAQSNPTSVPTTGPAKAALDREVAHLASIRARLSKHPALVENPYVKLELSLADRFIARAQSGGSSGDKEKEWKQLQMDEVGFLLEHTEQAIDDIESGKLPEEGMGPVPMPTGGPVKVDDGVFVTDTIFLPGDTPKIRPFYFGGYGHFQRIVTDLPFFPTIGATLVQDGRNGPAQGLSREMTLTAAGLDIKTTLDKAAAAGMKMDILTSPHYFPAWAVAEAPDMANGMAFNNIDHPKERQVIETYLKLLAQRNKDCPALMSYCLSNEPMYSASGRDKFSAPAWHAFLKARHGTIDNLNALYQSNFKSFDDVPADGWKDDVPGKRRAFDWCTFNDEHFAAWHKWMGDVLRKEDPRVMTHAKIMVFFSLDHDKTGWGIDPEDFCNATDIAGCDAYAQMIAGVGPLDETTSKEYAYHWQVEEMCYDLLHSFRNQPVFNSENHPIENADGAYRYPSRQSRAVIWQGGLHHQGATTTWVWEDPPTDPSLLHSIFYRPAYCWGQQRALLDLNRLSEEVTAINRANPTVAILYSPTSRFWDADYATSVRTIYTALCFLGDTITFVSEKQLATGHIPPVQAIILPHATHVATDAAKVLRERSKAGNLLFAAGDECMKYNEYHHIVTGETLASSVSLKSEREATEDLRRVLNVPARNALIDVATNKPAFGIEYKLVQHGHAILVPLINFLKQAQTVNVVIDHGEDEGIDLLSGATVSLKQLKLNPMEPMLLKVSWK